jgi:hypothetical protein
MFVSYIGSYAKSLENHLCNLQWIKASLHLRSAPTTLLPVLRMPMALPSIPHQLLTILSLISGTKAPTPLLRINILWVVPCNPSLPTSHRRREIIGLPRPDQAIPFQQSHKELILHMILLLSTLAMVWGALPIRTPFLPPRQVLRQAVHLVIPAARAREDQSLYIPVGCVGGQAISRIVFRTVRNAIRDRKHMSVEVNVE